MEETRKQREPPPLGSRTWTSEEIAYLEEKWGTVSIPAIAQRLNRTINAVKTRARKSGLGPVLMGGEYVTFHQLVVALGYSGSSDNYKTTSWIKNRGFPIHRKKVDQCSFRVVYLDEFWEWAEKNRSFLDFSKMEPLALGEEPAWVAEQRRHDYNAFALQRKDPWTAAEDQRLLMLLGQHKYGYLELSQMLGRSAGSIQRRCQDLGTNLRPIKADNHGASAQWTETDYQALAEGIKAGESYTVIGNRIGKSEKAVRGKVYFAYLTEDADRIRAYMGGGHWGDGAPVPTVRQGYNLSRTRTQTRADVQRLCDVLLYRTLQMKKADYDYYFQRGICMRWNLRDSVCEAGETDCDGCTAFQRIRPQYCCRCGATFYERTEETFCITCRRARKKQAQRKWARLNK